MAKSRILVIDDEALMREYVEEALVRSGYEVTTATNGRDGLQLLREKGFDAVVTDLKMTPVDGLEVVRRIREEKLDTRCIVMTAYGTIETAVAALKDGAEDYILKPFSPDVLELAVARALERGRVAEENRYLRAQLNRNYDCKALIGKSAAMRKVYAEIEKVASSRATVLVRGESGTGKELVAHALHYNGPRADRPFIKVNCAALSAGLLESELFGHEKGAFTGAHERKIGRFELADTGTLLLDEVSEIGLELQPKLLRALQEREFERVGGVSSIQVDTRIVATSNRNLELAVEKGQLREDLFFRLNVIQIVLPPLRERKDDIPPLMDYFLERYARENGRKITGFAPETRELFLDYAWPGNVRELQNAIERAVVLAADKILRPEHFLLGAVRRPAGETGLTPGVTLAETEKQLILKTLEYCKQNRTHAAKVLGISVRTLRNKLKEYGP
ncbi:MAG TPA: sigma-54 dependent transcriptional regulator [Candidatus Hydrogenedentes bacterium]|nr:sigma-54 dependent transcriptional regulator [Candidatus Hydrogenedentota bacterium]HPC18229.1 sigma-54 dependent transcriptional regulator [Candidatus Hydrogenedentota bacterium]HRT21880.1 sigma-54 dependent transcriptional regulator [Candidatus Hydrogenedentota bacterium]HRT66622.1 sigma-54 dependent transcriptional regulator [Candidatus Hydrogenedentota bacterium]